MILTYGNLPTFEQFQSHYIQEMWRPDVEYKIRRDPYFGDGDLTCEELYEQIERARDEWELTGHEPAGDFASCVLQSLGFEWV